MEEKNMNELLKKAEVLIEALPYIQRFNRKIIVVNRNSTASVSLSNTAEVQWSTRN